MPEPLHFAVVLDTPPDAIPFPLHRVEIECGYSEGWKDYRGTLFSYSRDPGEEEINEDLRFSSDVELSAWLDATIQKYRNLGFVITKYKSNGLDIDWMAGINLPPIDDGQRSCKL